MTRLTNVPEYSVSELSNAVKRTLEDGFDHVRVRGEVGRLSRPGSGHLYFDLKDENAVISAVAWKGIAGRWRFQPEQGLEVIVTGKLTTFAGQSKYQIIVETVEPAGVGALMALLDERRKKARGRGPVRSGPQAGTALSATCHRCGHLADRRRYPRYPASSGRPFSDPCRGLAGPRAGRKRRR